MESLPSVCFFSDANQALLPGSSSPWATLAGNFLVQRLCRNPKYLSYHVLSDLQLAASVTAAEFCAVWISILVGSQVMLPFSSLLPAISLSFGLFFLLISPAL